MDLACQEGLQACRRQIGVLRILCLGQFLILIAVVSALLLVRPVRAGSSSGVLRARGLIIEDASGRPRILLGAPFPQVTARKRQDEGSAAILFLNQTGADRLLIGEGIGAQINGKVYSQERRSVNGSAYGVTIMDGAGNERGGFGFTAASSGGGRALIALDRVVGDAWGAVVDDKTNWAGEMFNYPMPLGQYQPALEIGILGDRPFLHFKDKNDNARAEIALAPDGTPSLTVADSQGRAIQDLFPSSK